MARPSLSLCMIARDEEQLLPGCLESVRGVVDEIILVDTGSTDRTRDLAAAVGARVLERPWDDDFAAPRNLAVQHATGDWVLQLDADERLMPGSGRVLRQAMRHPRAGDAGMLTFHSASRVDAPLAEVVAGRLRLGEPALLPRLLRRAGELRWEGIIHESVLEWAVSRGTRLFKVEADVVHLGYVPDVRQAREKRRRNIELLRRRAEREPRSIVPLGYLAIECFAIREVDAAVEAVERGWALLDEQPSHVSVGRLAVARAMIAAFRKDAPRIHASLDRVESRERPGPDYDFLRGCAFEIEATALPAGAPGRTELLDRAIARHRQALERLRIGGNELVIVGVEVDVRMRLGGALLARGLPGEARAAFQAAARVGGGDRARLGEVEACLAGGDAAQALALVQPVLQSQPRAWALAARAAHALGALRDAELFMAKARVAAAEAR